MPCDMQKEMLTKAAIEWLEQNTTIKVDLKNPEVFTTLPARAQLFVKKFTEIMQRTAGVTSQSIEGLSMSFNSGDVSASINQLAYSLLQHDMKSQVRVIPARRRW